MIVAIDTGFLFQLADVEDETWNLYAQLLEATAQFHLITTPAVSDILELLAYSSESRVVQRIRRIWRGLSGEWRIANVALTESQKKVAWIYRYHFREVRLLEKEERLEAQVLGEAALVADLLLAAPDSSLGRVDVKPLIFETRFLGRPGLAVFTPAQLSSYLAR